MNLFSRAVYILYLNPRVMAASSRGYVLRIVVIFFWQALLFESFKLDKKYLCNYSYTIGILKKL